MSHGSTEGRNERNEKKEKKLPTKLFFASDLGFFLASALGKQTHHVLQQYVLALEHSSSSSSSMTNGNPLPVHSAAVPVHSLCIRHHPIPSLRIIPFSRLGCIFARPLSLSHLFFFSPGSISPSNTSTIFLIYLSVKDRPNHSIHSIPPSSPPHPSSARRQNKQITHCAICLLVPATCHLIGPFPIVGLRGKRGKWEARVELRGKACRSYRVTCLTYV